MNEAKLCAVCGRRYQSEQDYLVGTSRWRVCSAGNLWFNCSCESTLLITKGKFPWYSPDQFMGEESRSVFNKLGNLKDLPHIPSAVLEIQRLLQQPDVDPKVIARELRKEPVLATQILQLAEGFRRTRNPATPKINALEHAIVYIGLKPLSELVLTSSLRTLRAPQSSFDLDQYWTDAYVTGAIAEVLLRRYSPHLNPDEAFLAACLCNIGKLVIAYCLPNQGNGICRDIAGTTGPLISWREAEKKHGVPDHCILGEIAATLWGFPTSLMEAIRKHHHPVAPTGAALPLTQITAVANQMTHWVQLRPHLMEHDIISGFKQRVGLSESALDSFALELTELKQKIIAVRTPMV